MLRAQTEMTGVAEWVKGAIEAAGLNQSELARKLGERLGKPYYQTTIYRMMSGERELKFDEMVAISLITNHALPLPQDSNRVIPVSGGIREGGIVVEYKSPLDFVQMPPDGRTDVVAYEVLGANAAVGIAYDKWVIYFEDKQRPPVQEDIGKPVLVKIDGHPGPLLKIIEKNNGSGWRLRSTLTDGVIDNPDIEWISTLVWIKPR